MILNFMKPNRLNVLDSDADQFIKDVINGQNITANFRNVIRLYYETGL